MRGLEPSASTLRMSGSRCFDQGLSEDFPGGAFRSPQVPPKITSFVGVTLRDLIGRLNREQGLAAASSASSRPRSGERRGPGDSYEPFTTAALRVVPKAAPWPLTPQPARYQSRRPGRMPSRRRAPESSVLPARGQSSRSIPYSASR